MSIWSDEHRRIRGCENTTATGCEDCGAVPPMHGEGL